MKKKTRTQRKKKGTAAALAVRMEVVQPRIHLLRGYQTMLSYDLAELYRVEPRALVQAVKRNSERFPEDFMFQITTKESENLKSQFVISSWGGARRALPYAFTEQGVAMLSSVLKSERAVRANITIIRTFVRLRHAASIDAGLAHRVDELERQYRSHEARLGDHAQIFAAVKKLLTAPEPAPRKARYGFPTGKPSARAAANTNR
jgi:ORF6N domain